MELVLVRPMTAMHGYVTYFEYSKGSNKGSSAVGDLITNPFKLGTVDPNYTSGSVVENKTAASSATEVELGWCPVVPGSINFEIGADKYFDAAGILYKGTFASKVFSAEQADGNGRIEGVAGHFEVNPGAATPVGTVVYGYPGSKSVTGAIYDGAAKAKITFTSSPFAAKTTFAVNYLYNNIAIMQNDIPQVTVQAKGIYLAAKARRIAINYSQMAQFQAKQEYGEDIASKLEKVAVGTLKYEIDTEIVNLLVANAAVDGDLTFNATPRTGVSLSQHYEGFAKVLEDAKMKVYGKTQKFFPNYMIISSTVLPVIRFLNGWKEASLNSVAGPFLAGTLGNLKVFVTPNIAANAFVLGVNQNDFDCSAAVYAPYMAIVPTALLQTPDGASTQGWSTLYALELLNKDLLIAGKIEYAPQSIAITTEE